MHKKVSGIKLPQLNYNVEETWLNKLLGDPLGVAELFNVCDSICFLNVL